MPYGKLVHLSGSYLKLLKKTNSNNYLLAKLSFLLKNNDKISFFSSFFFTWTKCLGSQDWMKKCTKKNYFVYDVFQHRKNTVLSPGFVSWLDGVGWVSQADFHNLTFETAIKIGEMCANIIPGSRSALMTSGWRKAIFVIQYLLCFCLSCFFAMGCEFLDGGGVKTCMWMSIAITSQDRSYSSAHQWMDG